MEPELFPVDPLEVTASRTPGAVAVVTDEGDPVTYAELDDLVAVDLAEGADHTAPVRRGQVVPVAASVDLATIVSLWAVWRRGAVALPYDPALEGDGEPRAAWQIPPAGSTAATVADQHTWVMTSGSSGSPRPVVLTHDNVAASVAASQTRLGNAADDRWLLTLPLFHVGGLSILWRTVAAGGTVVIHSRFDAERAATALASGDVTYASLVPTMLGRIIDYGYPPSSALVGVLLGGAATPPGMLAAAHGLGYPVLPTYGMTETCSQAVTAAPGENIPPDGTIGRPLDGFEVVIGRPSRPSGASTEQDPDPLTPGSVGEIIVDGPAVSPGYAFDPPRNGPFRTADLGRLDGKGRLVVLGRTDDVIITGGENVVPATVERHIETHPDVAACVVFGAPDVDWGEVVVAVVVPVGRQLTEQELDDHARRHVRPAEIPRRWHLVDSLPELANGKVDRVTTRDSYRTGTG